MSHVKHTSVLPLTTLTHSLTHSLLAGLAVNVSAGTASYSVAGTWINTRTQSRFSIWPHTSILSPSDVVAANRHILCTHRRENKVNNRHSSRLVESDIKWLGVVLQEQMSSIHNAVCSVSSSSATQYTERLSLTHTTTQHSLSDDNHTPQPPTSVLCEYD